MAMAVDTSSIRETTLSEIVPLGDLSAEERRYIRQTVDVNLVKLAILKAISNDPSGLVLRDLLPYTDLGLTGATNGNEWLITSAATAGTLLQYFSYQLSTTQCFAFWGVSLSPDSVSNISTLRFLFGPGGAQVKAYFQLEQLYNRLEPQGYFSSPLYYVAQDTVICQVGPLTSFAASSERLPLLARVVDQFGNVISAHNVGPS